MSGGKIKLAEELRRRAEKRIQEQKRKVNAPTTFAESQRIVHELEVHQIELEMQNDELQQARAELESFLVQYTDLYDFAPVGYLTLNSSGIILQVNLTGAQMLGLERSHLVSQNFIRFIAADSQSEFTAFLEEVFNNHSQASVMIGLQKEDGGRIFAHVEARGSEEGQECRIALIDITAQKQAEELLEESEQKYRTLFETITQGVVLCGQDGEVISANPAAERILGLSFDQMQATSSTGIFTKAIHEDGTVFSGETHPSRAALRMGKAIHNEVMGILSPRSPQYIWLEMTALPLTMPGKARAVHVLITFEDITFQKRLLVYNLLTAREKEVFKLMVRGYGRKIIAEYLDIRPKTVDKHKENLMEKLNLHEQEEFMLFAKQIGIVKK